MKYAFLLIAVFFCGGFPVDAGDWEQLREAAKNRPRRVIYNNDADDGTWFPANLPPTPENFLARRMKTMEGSAVDTMFYCLQISFGHTVYDSKVGKMVERNTQRPGVAVAGTELKKQGIDLVELVIGEARKQGREIFGSFRMNDIHDSWWTPGETQKWVWLFSDFKKKHPELLFGSHSNRAPFGQWSAVDYEAPLVRETFVKLFVEACAKYDMDGFEFDFFRWPYLFKSVGWGKPAAQEQRDLLTGMMRELRAVAERCGKERGRPVLLAVRVPDSVEYCRGIGIDLERWFADGLVDLYVGGGNMKLNTYAYSVELAKKYGVKYYPSLDLPQFDEPRGFLYRDSDAAWRGRAAAALRAGADGIYYFNVFSNERVKKLMLGSPEALRNLDKRYFVTDVIIDQPGAYLADGAKLAGIRRLSPRELCIVAPGAPEEFVMELADSERSEPYVFLKGSMPEGVAMTLHVNGRSIPESGRGETMRSFDLTGAELRPGVNRFGVSLTGEAASAPSFRTVMKGDRLLKGQIQFPWRRLYTSSNPEAERIVDGAYLIADTGNGGGDIANLLYPIAHHPEVAAVKFECKVLASDDPKAVLLRFADGRHVETVSLEKGRISLLNGGGSVPFDTAGAFHVYELRMAPDRVELFADGRKLLQAKPKGKGELTGYTYYLERMHDSSLLLGSLSGPGSGSALWRNVAIAEDARCAVISDLVLDTVYSKAATEKEFATVELAAPGSASIPVVIPAGSAPDMTLSANIRRAGTGFFILSNGRQASSVRLEGDGISAIDRAVYGAPAPAPHPVRKEAFHAELHMAQLRIWLDGREVFSRDRTVSPEAFLAQHGELLDEREREIVRTGGAIFKGLPVSDLRVSVDRVPVELLDKALQGPFRDGVELRPGGAIPGVLLNTYGKNCESSAEGFRLRQEGSPIFRLKGVPPLLTSNAVVAGGFVLRAEKCVPDRALFHFALSPLVIRIFPDKLQVIGVGEAPFAAPITGRDVEITFALDAAHRIFLVKADGATLLAGRLKIQENGKKELWFGDGSAMVDGVVLLKSLRCGIVE